MNRTGEDLDANSAAAGFAGFLAKFWASVNAGEELVEREARGGFGARTAADGEALAVGKRRVLGWVTLMLEVPGKLI